MRFKGPAWSGPCSSLHHTPYHPSHWMYVCCHTDDSDSRCIGSSSVCSILHRSLSHFRGLLCTPTHSSITVLLLTLLYFLHNTFHYQIVNELFRHLFPVCQAPLDCKLQKLTVYIVQYIWSILYTTMLLMPEIQLKPVDKYLLIEDMIGCTKCE